jgi:hypothetical protein
MLNFNNTDNWTTPHFITCIKKYTYHEEYLYILYSDNSTAIVWCKDEEKVREYLISFSKMKMNQKRRKMYGVTR